MSLCADLMVILRDLEASAASGAAGRQVEELKKQIDLQKTAAEDLAARNAELEKECHVSGGQLYRHPIRTQLQHANTFSR